MSAVALALWLAFGQPQHWLLRLVLWLGGFAAVLQSVSALNQTWTHLCTSVIVADKEAEASYVCPLGTCNPANPRAFLDVAIGGVGVGRVEFEIKAEVVPRTAKNFLALCSGEGTGGSTYRGSTFHHVIRGFMCQGGITTDGFSSIYGASFEDENFDLEHAGPGVLSMANAGRDTNGSQWCVGRASDTNATLQRTGAPSSPIALSSLRACARWCGRRFVCVKATPHLDGRHVVFGQVLRGYGVIKAIESVGSSLNPLGWTSQPVTITACGVLEPRAEAETAEAAGRWPAPQPV